ncbi:MAG: hypothetical protein AAF944_20230 [Bacteroidota bacterium]
MKHFVISTLLLLAPLCSAMGQFGINYYLSDLSFAGFYYTFANRLTGEFRLNTSVFVEDLSPELVATYRFVNQDSHAAYAGVGGRFNAFPGVVLPIGFQVSPFEGMRNFAISSELAILAISEGDTILRGAIGFRYYFVRGDP